MQTWAQAEDTELHLYPDQVIGHIPEDFLGFGYETSAVARPGYFSPKDEVLVRLYRNLGTHGLVRIGGNISDYTRYDPSGSSVANPEPQETRINRSELQELGAFFRARFSAGRRMVRTIRAKGVARRGTPDTALLSC